MQPYYDHAGITIYHGDCREILPRMAAESLVTDPPWQRCHPARLRLYGMSGRPKGCPSQ